MSAASTITATMLVVGASATLGAAYVQGWGAFGEFGPFARPAPSRTTCQPQVIAIGWSRGAGAIALAETRALVAWSRKVEASHGPDYTAWHNAQRRSRECHRISGAAKCTIRGRPCRPAFNTRPRDILF